jgi:hypothetical protein
VRARRTATGESTTEIHLLEASKALAAAAANLIRQDLGLPPPPFG